MDLPKGIEELMGLAVAEATSAKAEAIEPAHLFVAACRQEFSPLVAALEVQGLDPKALRRRVRAIGYKSETLLIDEPKRISSRVWRILDNAIGRTEALKQEATTTHLIIALLRHPDVTLKQIFDLENLPLQQLLDHLEQGVALDREQTATTNPVVRGDHLPTPLLDRYGRDYTGLAKEGKLDPVIGRRDETKQVVRILLQKQKNNPVLVGEAGVGKTSIVEGLALRIAAIDAPADIRDWRIVVLAVSALVAGTTYRGEFEERLQNMIDEAESDPHLILFLDELHTLVGAGSISGSLDAANILKPALARGRIRLIGATTPDEYRKYIEKDSALERRLQPVRVDEPTPEQTREILSKLRSTYEAHHKVEITDEAIDAAVELSVKHLPDRRLPDKARDLIDRAAVAKRFLTFSPIVVADADHERVTRNDVAEVVAEWTGVPVERLTADEQERLLEMEDALRKRVIGQDHAIDALTQSIKTAMSGLSDPSRPYGVFLFMGPTGVGKTELAKALAEFLFGDERRLVRFDMSEYMEEHTVSKLIGAPPGYVGHDEGGALTNTVRRTPYCVLLFDEIEKAHSRVSDIFLQIFDDGRLTDSHGRTADFRHSVIILTSNLKEEVERKPVRGFRRTGAAEEIDDHDGELSRDELQKLLLTRFRPELVNRFNRIIQFHSLGASQVRDIIDKLILRVQERLANKNIELRLASSVYESLMKLGYKPEWGAREMERVVEQRIVQPLAQRLIAGEFKNGDVVHVVSEGDEVILTTTAPSPVEFDPSTGDVLLTTMTQDDRSEVALLLLDIVNSTEIVKRDGDTFMMRQMRSINETIRSHRTVSGLRFMKFTGDGFLVLFDDVASAVDLAHSLRTLSLTASWNLRFVVHYGAVRMEFDGDPIGAEVHRLFRIEALDQANCVSRAPGGGELPKHSWIVITPAAINQLSEEKRTEFEALGKFRLKGFDEPEEIWVEKAVYQSL